MALVGRRLEIGWISRALSSTAVGKKVALVLSGCGVYDGSEIHEASACLVHLSRHGAEVAMFAPDIPQMHVVNHLTGQPAEGDTRKVLVESARIARGAISPLSQLIVGHFSAVVLPGGFGAAKNLSSYAVEGEEMEVETEAKRVLEQFRAAGKPIGLCCISPVLAARLFPGVAVTVGDDTDPAACAVRGMGASHVPRPVTEVCLDSERLVVTTPAYMYEAPLHQIFDGIGEMISTVLRLVK